MATIGPEPDQSEASQLGRILEERTAERDGALRLLSRVVVALERHGGYLVPEDQFSLAAAVDALETYGLRKAKPRTPWRERK